MTELTPQRRRELRSAAHHLNPVVSIAANGLTPSVLKEIENSLQAHELIKIKTHGNERKEREMLMDEVCAALDAAPVQHIGTILVVWRKRREESATAAPKSPNRLEKRASTAKSARAFTASARRTALGQAAAEKKRRSTRAPKRARRKTGE